jgi:cell wall-associated NlpC family hydrolase
MKHIYAIAISLAVLVAPWAVNSGVATAAPGSSQAGHQQAIDYVIQRGLSQRGVPYSWAGGGASGPTRGTGSGLYTVGFDASGLMQYAFAGVGVKLPRSSAEQYNTGRKVAPAQARRGDLIFYGPGGSQSVTLFLGNAQMLEVSDAVTISPVRTRDMAPYLVRVIA